MWPHNAEMPPARGTLDMSVPAVLERAADLIDRRGKAVGNYQDSDGRLCALGAIAVACGQPAPLRTLVTASPDRAVSHLSDYVYLVEGWATGGVPGWSDAHTTSHVIAGLRAAARWSRG